MYARAIRQPSVETEACRAGAGPATELVHQMRQGREESEEQLLQAQKMEIVGRLAGGVAHDFNNILTAIAFNAELLLGKLEPGNPLRQRAEDIKAAAKRASSLTNQLLTFSRRQVRRPRLLNLNEIVADVKNLVERVIGEDVDIVDRLATGLWRIRADPSQLEQVILNLVINARDAMPDGGRLTLETANVELGEGLACTAGTLVPGAYVRLTVTDAGAGMDAELKANIFEPFFTTKGSRGTGLGLSTVYGIVDQSDGHIVVESEIGRGTTFEVYLPRTLETAPTAPLWEPSGIITPGSETILVVEDDRALRMLMIEALSLQGYRTLGAGSGNKALAKAEDALAAVDLLITDVIMPGLRGPELVTELQASGHRMKVLYVSGYIDDEALRRNVETESIPFLAKPFSCAQLTCRVREVLDGVVNGTN
jgi:two-component system, cell cycle sensor histidine kinase and response regulator CckA